MGKGPSCLSFPKETARTAAPITIHDFRADDETGPLTDVISENGNGGLTDDVFRHVFRVYPNVPSPYYEHAAAG